MPDLRRSALAAAGVVLAAAGGVWWAEDGTSGTAVPSAASEDARTTGRADTTGTTATPEVAPVTPGAPERVTIPALHVSAPVLPVRAPDRTLVPPSDPTELGWWADGARPGDARGSVLIAGHTVHTGGGALDDLEQLRRGDTVVVRTTHGRLTYVVRTERVYTKGRVADDAERLFSQDVAGRLVLVTCEDWDGERYLSNVVVVATPRS
ncbi:class F sortase [Nocardioides mangrovi]|uniref:Class F sortase n=1 Tax=Nocardioides mangrovi TaxID=2874580 RepID=A0ABS7UFX2_9ACTN|nr:class F sortase [Nocardioides mangrovi]MBZ5739928.1 class F sortase [Nocardioides mangrovi]